MKKRDMLLDWAKDRGWFCLRDIPHAELGMTRQTTSTALIDLCYQKKMLSKVKGQRWYKFNDKFNVKAPTEVKEDKRTFEQNVGAVFRRLRKAHKYTLSDFDLSVGLSTNALARFEKGQQKLPLTTMSFLAQALGANLSDVIKEAETAK